MQRMRHLAALLAGLIAVGVVGCAPTVNSQPGPQAPVAPAARPSIAPPAAPRQGMSTRNKVLLVAGAAALYYLYKKHQNAQGAGAQGQYYRSKNGGIYYRDAKNPKIVHWVTAPQQPIQVPADEYARYTGQPVQGNNGQPITQAPAGWQ